MHEPTVGIRAPGHEVDAGESGDERRFRVAEHVAGGALLHHLAVLQDGGALGQHDGVEHIVGDEDHRDAAAIAQLGDEPTGLGRRLRIEAGERFVQQQRTGARGQSAGDRDALLLPARQLRGAAILEPRHADLVQQSGRFGTGLRTSTALCERPEGDIVEHREVREQQRALTEQADTTVLGRHPSTVRGVQFGVAEADRSCDVVHVSGDGAEQGRLAGTVRAEHGQDLTRLGTHLPLQREAADASSDIDAESRARTATHRTAPGRHPRMSTRTAMATRMSISDSAIAVSSRTPAPLKAV